MYRSRYHDESKSDNFFLSSEWISMIEFFPAFFYWEKSMFHLCFLFIDPSRYKNLISHSYIKTYLFSFSSFLFFFPSSSFFPFDVNNIRQLYRQKLPTKRVNYSTFLFHGTLMVYHGTRPVYYKRCTACRRATRAVNVSERSIFRESWNMPGFEPLSVIGTGAKIKIGGKRFAIGSFVPDILKTERDIYI